MKSDNLILWLATIYHFVCGLGILIDPNARHVTGTGFVFKSFGAADCWIYFLICGMAVLGLLRKIEKGYLAVALMLPQQVVLLITGVGEAIVIWQGVYPDGYVPAGGSIFLLVDQSPPLLLAIGHTAVVFTKWFQVAKK